MAMAVAYSSGQAQLNSYRNQSVVGLTPAGLLLKTYDLILGALDSKDGERACRGLAQLIDCLDFRHAEVANGLFRLYRYCIEEIKKGDLEVATSILRELRQTWAEALDRMSTTVS
jgi:flagellar secretion chaperone FliS